VTFVAPRVSGQISRVLVDDNYRVQKGELLAALDKEPYQIAVSQKRAAVDTANTDLQAAIATARGNEAQAMSRRWKLQSAVEDLENQIALLHDRVAALDKAKATLALAQVNFDRAKQLLGTPAESRQQYDQRQEEFSTANAQVIQSLAAVHQVRASLGLPPEPKQGGDLGQVPPDLDQTFSSVLQAQADLIESAAQLGVIHSFDQSPKQMVEEFEKKGDVDLVFAKLAMEAPGVKQAEAKLEVAKCDLAQAELDLRYCNIVAEIDGVVTRRNVNPISGSTRISKRRSCATYVSARLPICMSTCTAAGTYSRAGSPALRWGPGRRSRCCRRRMRRATSSKSYSGYRSGLTSKDTTRTKTLCSPVLPSFHTSTSTSRLPDPMPGSFCKPRRLNPKPPACPRTRRA
jgi:multidrug resistance efflux pump